MTAFNTHYLAITPRDPLIARDGRPFGRDQGFRMKSLDWLTPSVLAGSLRSLLGKQMGGNFNPELVAALKDLSIAGPFPVLAGQLYLPAPRDCIRDAKRADTPYSLRPFGLSDSEGCDLPWLGLIPAVLPDSVAEDFKPSSLPQFWSRALLTSWLEENGAALPKNGELFGPKSQTWLGTPEKDERQHVVINPETGSAFESELFSTVGLDFNLKTIVGDRSALPLAVRVSSPADSIFGESLSNLAALHPLGGERRLVYWEQSPYASLSPFWECPSGLTDAVSKKPGQLRLQLVSPAHFSGGWKPGWLLGGEHGLEGRPPLPGNRHGPLLRLVSAITGRWQPISGFSLEKRDFGIKPVRRLVPVGSVYFFEIAESLTPKVIAEFVRSAWLQPISDDSQDQRDGFGLAVWGVWNNHP